MSPSESRSELVLELAEQFIERYRKGERPALKEYVDRHPELAAEIQEVFPALAMMENIAVADESMEEAQADKPAKRTEDSLKQLGDFRIIREIGHGGMGVVYEAEQVSLGRHVALKVLPNQALQDAKHKRRFEREAKAAAKLHHTNIVPIFGVGEHNELPYYVMQFIQGLGLDVVLEELGRMQPGAAHTPSGMPTAGEIRISRRDVTAAEVARSLMTGAFQQTAADEEAAEANPQPTAAATLSQPAAGDSAPPSGLSATSNTSGLSESFTVSSSSISLPGNSSSAGHKSSARKQSYWQSVANIGRQVADALEYAHKQGILHRDIKPSNLLLDLRGTVWVTDFGLAKVAGPGAENLTHTGDILGTLRYMPPEAFEGKSDARSDVYSLGLTLYELMALRPAFAEKDRNKLIKLVTTGEPAALHRLNREAPRDLVTIVQKAIDREPGRRYTTAEDLASDLQRFIDDEPILARRQTPIERSWRWARHNPGMAALGGVLTAVLLIATVASLIVAGRMATLASSEAKAADDERTARNEADLAKQAAEESKQRAEQALTKAEENFAKARAAVNDYLTAVSEDDRLKAPGLQGLRIQLLQSALQFYQEFLKERGNDPTLRRELAGVYYKVGEIYRDLGQLPAASPAYAQARRMYDALAAESPDDPDLQHGLAMALYRSGARAQAIPILEKLINPEDPRYHSDLGYVYNDAAIQDAKTDKAKELEFLRKALTIRERLVHLKPDDPDARLGLSASLNNIAIRLNDDHNAEALALLQRAVEQCEAAYRLRPADLLTARFLMTQLNNVATKAKLAGETEVVLVAQRRRVEVLDRRARDNPTIAGFDADLVGGYAILLTEQRDAARWEEAAKTVERARVRLTETTEESTGFFGQMLRFHLTVHALALARAKADPDGEVNTEPEVAAAVNAARRLVLAGWRSPAFMRTDPQMEPLRQRADFKELLVRLDELGTADAKAKLTTATAEEKLAARQTILTTLEALAGPPPHVRFVRRNLAQAKQDLAQAMLEAGQVEDARLAFDDALLARQQLVQESPSNEQLRADLAQSQSAAGDLFATAGKLADAFTTWDKALATLEEGLKANPNSIPYQAALAERLLHVAYQEGQTGLLARALQHYRRSFQIQPPTRVDVVYFTAVLLARVGDVDELNRLAANVWTLRPTTALEKEHFIRLVDLVPSATAGHQDELRQLADEVNRPEARASERWIRGLTELRTGNPSAAVGLLTGANEFLPIWPTLALAQHQAGQVEAARATLREADLEADRQMRHAVVGDRLLFPLSYFDTWQHFKLLQREAHQAIHGQPPPDSPYERLHRGRVLMALGEADKAEVEFTAAVTLRPQDAEVWLTRSRIFAGLGQKDRMTADLLRAQELKGDDPKTWVETGRMLAERGEHKQAEAAFAKASVLGKGELHRFLEAGWWVVGPYPEQLDQACPPEFAADPSKPVAAVGQNRELKWLTTATTVHSGAVNPGRAAGASDKASFYYLAYVHADRDRTADLHLRTAGDARLWVNGRLAFDGVAAWGIGKEQSIRVPVLLRAGRNSVLVKVSGTKDRGWFECLFHDAPALRALDLADLGLWADAADVFADADRRAPLDAWRSLMRMRCLLAAGRDDEYRQAFAEMISRYDRPGSETVPGELMHACYLPPEKSPDRDRWVKVFAKNVDKTPGDAWAHYHLGQALYRAGRFEEAETSLRQGIKLEDSVYMAPILASTCFRLGKTDEAARILQRAEDRFAELVKADLEREGPYHVGWMWHARAHLLLILREARTLIGGKDPGTDANEPALQARARKFLGELDQAEDHFARLLLQHPNQPRLQIDRGRRLGELKRWDEATQAFAKAAELAPKSVEVWKERGRAYADLGKWDEAAADFVKALELVPKSTEPVWKFPWFIERGGIDDLLVQWDEVFDRVTGLRPKDSVLWARRAQHFARHGRWAEAESPLLRCHEFHSGNHWGPYQVAPLLLLRGDVDGYRRITSPMIKRHASAADWSTAEKVVRTVLLMQGETTDFAALTAMLDRGAQDAAKRSPSEASFALKWTRLARAHVAYRSGDFEGAIHQLTRAGPPMDGPSDMGAETLIVLAMARQKLGDSAAAREALAKARGIVAKHAARPELGWLYDGNWHHWVRSRVLMREAESIVAKDQAVAAGPGTLSSQEYAAQRERKARADRLATHAALAQIRVDVGQKQEAEAELRTILAEREKIAAEESGNLDYQTDLAAAHQQLGQFLVSDFRIEEGVKETQQAVALLEKFAAGNPKAAQLQVNLAANLFSVGDFHWKAGRLAEGRQAWQRALESLRTARDAAAKDPKLAKMAADLELVAGRAYADLGLWTEASGHFRRAFEVDPVAGKISDRLQHAELLVLIGDEASYRRYCNSVYERGGTNLQNWYSATMMVLRPGALPDAKTVAALVQEARNASKDEPWTVLDLALAQLRAEQVDAAFATFQEFEKISKREWQFGWPALALARHKAGKIDEAREWLQKTEDWYAGTWAKHLVADGTGLPKDGSLSFWAFFLSLRQEAIATVTGMPAPADAWLHLHRGRVYVRLGQSDKAEAEFQSAVKVQPDDPRIWLARSQIFAKLDRAKEAAADRAQALQLSEQALIKRPDDSAAADALAGLLLEKAESKWTALKPLTAKSEGGATLTVQPDDSVLASGTNPDQDVYVIDAEVQGRIGAIRLDAIPDRSMPAGGSGRAPTWGNFVLTDFQVMAGESVVTWSRAYADFSQELQFGQRKNFSIALAIDADESTGWAIWPRVAQSHWAVFIPSQPVTTAGKTRLTIRLAFQSKENRKYTLGRFRLSVAEVVPIEQTDWFLAASTPHAKVAASYLAIDDAKRATEFLSKATAANPKLPAADWLVLALAHARLKETDQARKACAKAAELLIPAGADAALRPLLREVLRVMGTDSPEAMALIAAASGELPAALNEAIQQNPDEAAGYRNRGDWYAERGRWKEAIADFAEYYRLQPDTYIGMRLGILLVHTGDIERYRAHCQTMLERFAATEKNGEADQTLKMVLLLPDYKADAKQLARLAEVAVSGDKNVDWFEWYLLAKGLHDYRTGKFADALATCRESRRRAPETKGAPPALATINLAIEAMALHRSGDEAGANRALAEAKSNVDLHVPGIDGGGWSHDWLAANILYREAESLLAAKKAEPK